MHRGKYLLSCLNIRYRKITQVNIFQIDLNLESRNIPVMVQDSSTHFEVLFKTHYAGLCRYALSYLDDHAQAEDIVQQVFLKFWEQYNNMQETNHPKAYLFAMVRNACLNQLKHSKIRQMYAQEHAGTPEPSHEPTDKPVREKELEQRIQKAMQQLPEQCRLIFKMSRFEELKYAEIAKNLNISVKTVENQMGKALKIMRFQLSDLLLLIIFFIAQ